MQKVALTHVVSKNRFLTFYILDEQYGVDILSVKEIIALMKTTKIPKTPKFVKGVMNLRGNIIPVIDLRLKFDMAEAEPQMYSAIIIVQIKNISIGFVVDKVEEVLTIENENLSETTAFGSNIDTKYIKNMARVGNNVTMILDLEKIFSNEEFIGIQSLTKE